MASYAKSLVERVFPSAPKGISHDEFLGKFVALVILASFSGTGIFGAMNEGMTGDPSILIVKSFLDFFTAMIFATTLGYAVTTIFIPQTLLQSILAYSAVFIIPFVTPEMRADFGAVGGVLMIATGFRILQYSNVPRSKYATGTFFSNADFPSLAKFFFNREEK